MKSIRRLLRIYVITVLQFDYIKIQIKYIDWKRFWKNKLGKIKVSMNREYWNHLYFTDVLIILESLNELREMLNDLNKDSLNVNLKMNRNKRKYSTVTFWKRS